MVDKLRAERAAERRQAEQDLLARRRETVAGLVELLRDRDVLANRRGTAQSAIYLLGEMRAVEAVPALVDIVAYPEGGFGPEGHRLFEVPPAPRLWWREPPERGPASALNKIGHPCLPAVVEKLGQTGSLTEMKACLNVLYRLLGRERALEELQTALDAAETEDERARLGRAVQWMRRAGEMPPLPPEGLGD
ncbi:MAG: hypothetical protein R6X33_07455 [Candidatus Brocadiia bacterium]